MPNGEINFEFVADNEDDETAARQATNMVSKVVNQMNDPHFILERWIMDAAMHKNGMMMIKPIRENITRYVETEGTLDQLRAFEQQAADSGLTALRQSKKQVNVMMDKVMAEVQQLLGDQQKMFNEDMITSQIERLKELPEEQDPESMAYEQEEMMAGQIEGQEEILQDAIKRNTIYKAKYKLTGYSINIKFDPIAQHYWILFFW